jgi:hypothetical protein
LYGVANVPLFLRYGGAENGTVVRAMQQPTPYVPLQASFENAKGQPVNMDGKTIHPPKGTTNTKQYIRERSHVQQTP